MANMPAFRDQEDPSVVWVWDAEAKDYAPKRLNKQPLRGWSSGGDNNLFDPSVHRFKPKNPTQTGILATQMSNEPGVNADQLHNACGCDAENMPHEWQPQWGCPHEGPAPVLSEAQDPMDFRDPPPMRTSDGPFPARVPRENTQRRDPSYPSMSLSNASGIGDMSRVREILAQQYEEKFGADLASCPDCATPLKESGGEMVCSGCGNKQPILTMSHRRTGLAMAALPLVGRLMGGAMGEGAMPGAAQMLGRGALFQMGQGLVPGVPGTPEEQELPMMPVQSVAKTAEFSQGIPLAPGAGYDGQAGHQAAEKYRQLRLQGVESGEAMQQVAAEFFGGDVAMAQHAVGSGVRLTGASDEDDEVGLATKNRGDDDNPEHKTQGFNEEHGDSPELLKDVDLLGGSREGEDHALGEDEAMSLFESNLPLVIQFAESEESGKDHPVLKMLDEVFESIFPGYKGSDDGDKPKPKEKEAASWTMPMQNDPGYAAPAGGQQPGVVGINDTCPIDGAGPGVPCAHKAVTQGTVTPGAAAPGIPGVPGIPSQVPHTMFSKTDDSFDKFAARKPKMCPYHSDLVDYSLMLGDPQAALGTIQPVAYGTSYCKSGEFEGSCNFKAPMVTQAYWDQKDAEYAERAEQRRREQEALQTQIEPPVAPQEEAPEYDIPEAEVHNVGVPAQVDDDGEGESLENAPTAVGEGIPAFASAEEDPVGHRTASRRKVSLFETMDVEAPTLESPQHILADREGENLHDDAPETHSEAREKRDMPEHHHPEAEHPESEENRSRATMHDSEGMPLQEGEDYLMKSPDYEIPDKVTIDAIEGDQITYTVHTELSEYQDTISMEQLRHDDLVFINDTTSRLTDSSEDAFGDEAPLSPRDRTVGPEQTDLSRLPTPVSRTAGDVPPEFEEHKFKKKDSEMGEEEGDDDTNDETDEEDVHESSVAPDEHKAAITRMEADPEAQGPVSRKEAMEHPELVQQGTEYMPKFAGDDLGDRAWIMDGDSSAVDIDPSLMAKFAGKNFTPREQREFIDESGQARNLDKLDLADTHYIEEDDLDSEFLFGGR